MITRTGLAALLLLSGVLTAGNASAGGDESRNSPGRKIVVTAALARLPAAERQAWQQLWAGLAELAREELFPRR